MTTISHNRRKSGSPLHTAPFFVLLVVLIGAVFLLRHQVGNVFWYVAEPILKTRILLGSGVSEFFGGFSSTMRLQEENRILREALASSSIALLDRNLLYKENVDLKSRMGRVADSNSLLASVLLHPPGAPYDTLIIDVGKGSGVTQGDLVSAGGLTLIGVVSDVYDTTARVVLFSAPGQVHEGMLAGSIPVSVEGSGAGSMRAEVPVGTAISVGDAIVFPGIMGGLTAYVSGVDSPEGSSFTIVYTALPVNIFSLRFVEVRLTQQIYEAS